MSVPAKIALQVEHASVEYGRGKSHVRAVCDVSFEMREGEILGIVGESGSGKSTLARLAWGLEPRARGRVTLLGKELHTLRGAALRRARVDFQAVFQDPRAALRPDVCVGDLLREPLLIHARAAAREEDFRGPVTEALVRVGLDASYVRRLPGELSGGQRQRVAIARALMTGPKLLLADEPLSALDVSIQAQIMELLRDLRERLGLSILLISHDLAVVRHLCDRVLVMNSGRIVEEGPVDEVLSRPKDAYTQRLVASLP
jgi:peptide/nickel transport system ATP-binding protein